MLHALVPEIDVPGISLRCPESRGRAARGARPRAPGDGDELGAFDSVEDGTSRRRSDARSEGDEIVVFGSFVTVERALRLATSRICPET